MLSKFKEYFKQEKIALNEFNFLLAISGGMDSMAMLDAFVKEKAQISVAHVNYNLRPEESLEEYRLVKNYCNNHHIPFYAKTLSPTELEGKNTQLLAREIRYEFFSAMATQHNATYICTAHHIEDSLETSLINLFRGTGIHGFKGIPERNQNILRPLSHCNKEDIKHYAEKNNVPFLNDSSNAKNQYLRNQFRNEIIPKIKNNTPNALKGYIKSRETLKNQSVMLRHFVEQWANQNIIKQDHLWKLNRKNLWPLHFASALLFEILNQFGFSYSQCQNLLQPKTDNGAYFVTESHEALVNNEFILLRKQALQTERIPNISFKKLEKMEAFPQSAFEEIIDYDKVKGELRLHRPDTGISFQPLGMKGKKKLILEYLNQQGVLSWDKKNCWILFDDHTPVWIVGHRLDQRYAVDKKSSHFLKLTFQPNAPRSVNVL